MQLSKFSDYSFRILIFAGTKNQLCTTSEVSKAFNISRHHLVKIIHRLEKLGFLKTKKGKNGGFQLNVDPSSIKIGKTLTIIEQNFDIVECFSSDKDQCKITSNCRLKHALHAAMGKFIDELNRYTLNDLLQPSNQLYRILLSA